MSNYHMPYQAAPRPRRQGLSKLWPPSDQRDCIKCRVTKPGWVTQRFVRIRGSVRQRDLGGRSGTLPPTDHLVDTTAGLSLVQPAAAHSISELDGPVRDRRRRPWGLQPVATAIALGIAVCWVAKTE
jgi:hypothetical protein